MCGTHLGCVKAGSNWSFLLCVYAWVVPVFVLLFARESRPSIIGRASEKKRRSLGPSFVKRW